MIRIYTLLFLINAFTAFSQTTTIQFAFDSYKLDAEAKQTIKAIDVSKTDSLIVSGIADTTGKKVYNYWLALHRAEAVQKFIAANTNFPPEKIIVKSEGESNSTNNKKEFRTVLVTLKQNKQTSSKSTEVEKENSIHSLPKVKTKIVKDTNALVVENFKIGKQLRLEKIHFRPGTDILYNKEALDQLNQLLKILETNPTITIDVQGHVCCTNNYELSKQRALVVANYLVQNGISKSRITYSAYSNSKPLVPETSDHNRQMNRRVEILVTGK